MFVEVSELGGGGGDVLSDACGSFWFLQDAWELVVSCNVIGSVGSERVIPCSLSLTGASFRFVAGGEPFLIFLTHHAREKS